jgi:DNA polymerase V
MAQETGFPSPARGYEAATIDLNELLVHNAPATYYMRMRGSQLVYRGVLPGDLLVVDRARAPVPGCMVVFRQDDEFTCRELVRDGDRYLLSDGDGHQNAVTEETEIFGTVTGVVRKL